MGNSRDCDGLEGNYVSQWGSAGSGDGQFNFPNSKAIDNNGHVYVTEANNHQVQKFDGDGHFLNRWSGLINTIGIVLSPKTGQLNVGGNLSFQLQKPSQMERVKTKQQTQRLQLVIQPSPRFRTTNSQRFLQEQ